MTVRLQQRRAVLTAAFAALQLDADDRALPELKLVHAWLDNWNGVGLIIGGMVHQGFGVSLTGDVERLVDDIPEDAAGWQCAGDRGLTQAATPWRTAPAGGVGGTTQKSRRPRTRFHGIGLTLYEPVTGS